MMNDRYSKLASRCSELVGKRNLLRTQFDQLTKEREQLFQMKESLLKIQAFFHSINSSEQEKLRVWIEGIITQGLGYVFDRDYRFVITPPEIKNNEVAVEFYVAENIDGKEVVRDPFNEMGGGVGDVLSYLLRFIVIYLMSDKVLPLIMLDESFRYIQQSLRPNMSQFVRDLTDKTGITTLLITHDDCFAQSGDVIYELSKSGTSAVVVQVK